MTVPGIEVTSAGIVVSSPAVARFIAVELGPAIHEAFEIGNPRRGRALMELGEIFARWSELAPPLSPVDVDDDPPETWPTTVQVGDALQVSRQRVGQLLAAGSLTGRKVAGCWRVDPETVEALMRRRALAA